MQNNLHVKDEFFVTRGYDTINFTVILREKIDSVISWTNSTKIQLPKDLEAFIPMGNPPSFFAGTATTNTGLYASIFISKDIAAHLLLHSTQESREHLALLLPAIKNDLYDFLVQQDQAPTQELMFSSTGFTPQELLLLKIKDIEGVLFSILTKRNTIIIGSTDELIQFFWEVFKVIPKPYRNFYDFTINIILPSSNHHPLIGVTPKFFENHKSYFEELLNRDEETSIVNLMEMVALSSYEVSLLNRVNANALNASVSEQLTGIHDVLAEIFLHASEIELDMAVAEFAEAKSMEYDISELIIDIKKRVLMKGGI